MKTYSKIIFSGVVLAAIGATAAVARNHGERGMGGPMGGEKMASSVLATLRSRRSRS